MLPVKEYSEDKYLIMATKNGTIKRTPLNEYKNMRKSGLLAITLREDDELIEAKTARDEDNILFVTKYGQCIKFAVNDVRKTGRSSIGVRGMNLSVGDEVVGMQLEKQGDSLLVVSEKGMGKRTSTEEFVLQRRGGKGVKCYKINDKTGNVIGVKAVTDESEIMMITTEGIIIQFEVKDISVIGRNTSGVKLMNIDKNSDVTIASIAKVRSKPETVNADDSQEDSVDAYDANDIDDSENESDTE